MDSPMKMMKMSDDNNRIVAEDVPETRFIGAIPNARTTPPLSTQSQQQQQHHHHYQQQQQQQQACLRVLHPDHVAVGSPITRVPSTPYSPFSSEFSFHHDQPTLTTDPVLTHDISRDFSRLNLFDPNPTDVDPYNLSRFNQTGTLPYHINNPVFYEKGYTFPTPDDHANHLFLVDQRRKQLQQDLAVTNYQTLRDRCMASSASQSLGGVKTPVRFSQITPLNPNEFTPSPQYYVAAKEKAELSHFLSPRRNPAAAAPAFRCDNSFIVQDVKHCYENGYTSYKRSATSAPRYEGGVGAGTVSKNFNFSGAANYGQNSTISGGSDLGLPMPMDFYFLSDTRSQIYNMARDQNGCRLLQRIVDDGTYQDMCVVFEGIIGSVVELMIDSFGNYLVQKLLDVCSDDQRLQIVLVLTNQPGQLVRISLNTHGTRVVQKLIETLNSEDQISLVKSAIQPGFLDLIKDLNGNHVIQRCLQCLSSQDNQFIFDAAVTFCVEIATHQHGCCVLQRCIDYSVGNNRDKLVKEICKHGLLLTQDPFGNYVVQYVIETDTPTASAKLLGQFKGNYVNLSTQKFSSHVVEKCLRHIADSRSTIVRELLCASRFEQLLQDPYANYVIQSALAVTKGPLHGSLVEAIRLHKILRTSPYCKRIFSGSLLKK